MHFTHLRSEDTTYLAPNTYLMKWDWVMIRPYLYRLSESNRNSKLMVQRREIPAPNANSFTNVFLRVSTKPPEKCNMLHGVQHAQIGHTLLPRQNRGHQSDQRLRISGGRCRN
eukprot:sb/3476953/